MTHRFSVTVTDELKERLDRYAREHGATLSGAITALASNRLDHLDDQAARKLLDAAAGRTPTPRRPR